MKSLIMTWEVFQDHEVIYPYYRLQEEGQVDVVANVTGKIFGILGAQPGGRYDAYGPDPRRCHALCRGGFGDG